MFLLTIGFFQYRFGSGHLNGGALFICKKQRLQKKFWKKNCSICSFDSTASSFWREVSSCEACGDVKPQYVEHQGSGRGKPLEIKKTLESACTALTLNFAKIFQNMLE